MGNDGSGKTTIARKLEKIFRELGFEVIYKHEYEYVLLRFLFKLIGKIKVEKARKEMLIEKRKSWKYYIWPILVWFDTLLQYLYFKIFKRNSIVILDRYPYDHYLSFKYLGYLTRLTEWLYLHFPKPDVGILLWVEPEIAYERKKETHDYSLEFYKIQTKRYLEFGKKKRIPTISTNKELKENLVEILDLIYNNKDLRKKIIKRGFQNKTYFEVFKNFKESLFWKSYEDIINQKIKQYRDTIKALLNLFKNVGIREYLIFKDYNDYFWVGNDVDILLSYEDFEKLVNHLQQQRDIKYKYNTGHDPPSIDLYIDYELLPLDIHLKIGWRKTETIRFRDIEEKRVIKNKFGVKYYGVKPEVDAFIYSLSHILDKGFVPKLEFEFILKHIKKLIKINNRFLNVNDYKEYLRLIGSKLNKEYPIFIPVTLTWKVIWSILTKKKLSSLEKLKISILIICMQILWRIRYKLIGKLPYEVKYYYEDSN